LALLAQDYLQLLIPSHTTFIDTVLKLILALLLMIHVPSNLVQIQWCAKLLWSSNAYF
jgi:hypothetical protein